MYRGLMMHWGIISLTTCSFHSKLSCPSFPEVPGIFPGRAPKLPLSTGIKLCCYSFPLRSPETKVVTVEKKMYITVKTGYFDNHVCALSYPDTVRRPSAVFTIYVKYLARCIRRIPSRRISFWPVHPPTQRSRKRMIRGIVLIISLLPLKSWILMNSFNVFVINYISFTTVSKGNCYWIVAKDSCFTTILLSLCWNEQRKPWYSNM